MPPGLDWAAMDPTVNACDDFYRFACGGWIDKTPIPADRDRTSRGFVAIADRNEGVLREILEQAAAGKLPEGTAFAKQLGDFYGTCIDEEKLETALPALEVELARFNAIKDPTSLATALGHLHAAGMPGLFQFSSAQDFKDSTQIIGELDQGGLGLPDRDYYLKDDAKTVEIRAAYARYVEQMFQLLGQAPAAAQKASAVVLALETELARASQSKVDRRDPLKVYHRLDRAGVKQQVPQFPWDKYLETIGAPAVQKLNVTSVEFFQKVGALAKATPVSTWKTYLTWNALHGMTLGLPKRFRDEQFRFNKVLTGAEVDRPRWKKCVRYTDDSLGEALGKAFVERTFGADAKATTLEMIRGLEQAFEKNLAQLEWMDAPTRAEAAVKVQKMVNKIGYPDRWRDYSTVQTDRSSFLSNALKANRFEVRRELAKIDRPLDRSEWQMSPDTVNAYNAGSLNEIVFPAGILQPPMFNRDATVAVNYGSMGMVVGHEITHGFDDEGRQFDAKGNLRDWWSPEVAARFLARTACLKKQYDGYLAVDDVHVNGALTLGENVADVGGLKIAHAAMERWLKEKPSKVEGYRFTPRQQFFLGFSQSWCSKVRPELARMFATTDPHSPPNWRVNGSLVNLKEFQQAFGCKEGSKMIRPAQERCEVW